MPSSKATTLASGSAILAQRDQLKAELASAHAAENQARLDRGRAETAISRANDERMRLYGKKARGTLDGLAELNDAENAWHGARREEMSQQGQMDAAKSAIAAVEAEIAALYREHLPVFAAEAERSTREAQAAIAALHEPYRLAHNAWSVARLAWAPLAPAITDAVTTADEQDGMWRDHSIGHRAAMVPELTLPGPGHLRSLPPPRPPAFTPVQHEEEPITGDAA